VTVASEPTAQAADALGSIRDGDRYGSADAYLQILP